jgi:hypothetical protein
MNLESIISNPYVIALFFYIIGYWQGKRHDHAIVDTVSTLEKDVLELDDKVSSLMVKTGLDDIDWKLNEWVDEESASKNE